MTIDQAYRFIIFIVNKKQSGRVTPEDFNLIAPMAQMEAIMKKVGNPKTYENGRPIPTVGYSMTQKTRDDIRPILVRSGTLASASNEVTYPADYLHYDVLEREDGTEIDIVLTSSVGKRRKSLINPPSANFPISAFYDDKIRVYPDLTDIRLTYIKIPDDPEWAYDVVNNAPVYNAGNSTDFSLPVDCHNEICMFILQHFGINLTMTEVTQYANMKETQGV
jgi:hypothetical protein